MISVVTGFGEVAAPVVRRLIERGDDVVILSRHASRALSSADPRLKAAAYDCDLTDDAGVEQAVASLRDRGPIGAVVLTAGGFALHRDLASTSAEEWRRLMAINLDTAVTATRHLLPLVEPAQGSFVYFASASALDEAVPESLAADTASKRAVLTLMHAVAARGRRTGVRANALAPGTIRTASNERDLGRTIPMVSVDRICDAVLALTDRASVRTGEVLRLAADR